MNLGAGKISRMKKIEGMRDKGVVMIHLNKEKRSDKRG